MNEIIAALRVALANVYVMYQRAHSYHWNVEGPNFNDYHQYFGELYSEVYGSIDKIAENIRKYGDYAPHSIDNLFSYRTVDEDTDVENDYKTMFNNLIMTNEEVINSLKVINRLATASGEAGLVNYTGERIDEHMKHAWQLKALAKTLGE